jgi:hypothetical protein
MKYLKTFESFSPINEEEGIFGALKKSLFGDVIEDNLIRFASIFKKSEDEIYKIVEQIRAEKDISKKNELLKSIIGDFEDKNRRDTLIRLGCKYNRVRYELDCMTPEEKEEFDSRPGGSTGWEGSRGFH